MSRFARAGRWVFRGYWAAAGLAVLALLASKAYFTGLAPTPHDLRVLGQGQWLPDSEAALHVRLVDRQTAAPVPGVPVVVELVGPRSARALKLADLKTGPDGSARPRFRVPDWPDGRYQLRVTARDGRATEAVDRPVKLVRSWQLMLSTDKPIYQPGQTIRVRALTLRRPDQKPVAGQELVFSVSDPKGNVVFRQRGVTSAYGIGSTDCPLADELIEGAYQIECQVGDTLSRATVSVRRYVLPKFKVSVALDQPYYEPGQVVRGTVRAEYTHGKPVAGAAVKVEALSTDVGPNAFRSIDAKTDEKGAAAFEFVLPEALAGRPQDSGAARVGVEVSVRDPAGQSQARRVECLVSASPIKIEVIPEAGTLVVGLPNRVYFFASYLDGRPARVTLNVTGLEHDLKTDATGVAAAEFTPDGQATRWTLQATDDEGHVGRREVSWPARMAGGGFLVRPDKAVYRGGETMVVRALGAGVEPIFLDLVKDGQTVLTESVPVEKGRGEYRLDLPPDLSGTVVLCAYRYGPEGLPVRQTRALYIEPARGLKIETTWDRAEYAPGGHATLTLALTDDKGNPAPGAISLAAVDEAVFAVLEQRPGLERTFFSLEQELLKPVYEIHDWSPGEFDDQPPDARTRFEQALFARTAHTGTRLDELRGQFDEEASAALRVLDRPDWEQLAATVDMPDRVLDMLHQAGAPHTLEASTYINKLKHVETARRAGLQRVQAVWPFLIVSAVVVGLIWLCISMRAFGIILVIWLILIALLLPAVQSAREAARRTQALNDVKSLAMATSEVPRAGGKGADGDSVRVRQWFPETLLWRPELVTDDHGRAAIDIDLADSITTWRLSASAVGRDGKLGGAQSALRVFQPFFVDLDLPVALTRGDEVGVPVVVSNYLDRAQDVSLKLRDAPWFERIGGDGEATLKLGPNEVRSVRFRLRARKVGRHELEVTARGGEVADAVRRSIEVVPEGRRVEQVASGTLAQPAEVAMDAPGSAVEGSVKAFVKIYPSSFSQLVEGLDAIFQRPYGCFEQTSSTTYPNVLALDYLRRTGLSVPEVEAKARQYIHLGYQRLVSFEVAGGGFDWFGNPPANRTLTAYGLMEFQDMARVHDVDPNLIERTRSWLLGQQQADGSWAPDSSHLLHEDPTGAGRDNRLARLTATAYIASAVFAGREGDPNARAALAVLTSEPADAIDDPHALALVANALLALDPNGISAAAYLDRLIALKRESDGGKLVWWEQPPSRHTLFYGAGAGGAVETTALAAQALLTSGRAPGASRGALSWLVAHKDAQGTWHSTQATVQALRALLAGTGKPLGGDRPRRISLALDGEALPEISIAADQADVVRQVDLSDRLSRGDGPHRLTLTDRGGTDAGYQVVFRYHVPDAPVSPEDEPLSIRVEYDRTTLAVDDLVTVSATVTNRRAEVAPMVILDLPVPGGFALEADDLSALVKSGAIAKFQVTPRSAVVYLRGLEPNAPLALKYRLRAVMPVKLAVPPARAYEYYDPARHGSSAGARLTVEARD